MKFIREIQFIKYLFIEIYDGNWGGSIVAREIGLRWKEKAQSYVRIYDLPNFSSSYVTLKVSLDTNDDDDDDDDVKITLLML